MITENIKWKMRERRKAIFGINFIYSARQRHPQQEFFVFCFEIVSFHHRKHQNFLSNEKGETIFHGKQFSLAREDFVKHIFLSSPVEM